MKKIENLVVGDVIAFGFDLNGELPRVEVASIKHIDNSGFMCHFLVGFRSECEIVKQVLFL
jgi:hypothetical protein